MVRSPTCFDLVIFETRHSGLGGLDPSVACEEAGGEISRERLLLLVDGFDEAWAIAALLLVGRETAISFPRTSTKPGQNYFELYFNGTAFPSRRIV